jgi:hypothetical protein
VRSHDDHVSEDHAECHELSFRTGALRSTGVPKPRTSGGLRIERAPEWPGAGRRRITNAIRAAAAHSAPEGYQTTSYARPEDVPGDAAEEGHQRGADLVGGEHPAEAINEVISRRRPVNAPGLHGAVGVLR